ncbi:hypothetical protein PSTG_13056 [Puccinia striiformis f. sp. tritici PST-78]|uniref:CxC1-like cysteine cluster associated with KDZ transposases domain-containing protein n=1 Tax=Puccinia striiformis f. sp. tritici PST-78 TaxID=1165861 RepID=A0A0L0V2U8_9BASI|nr:hypothetical protein PSTG_13056 [Puccinia striiformis f. sp. tritici PST-78]
MARINVKNPVANRALFTPSRPALTMGKIRMKIPVGNRTQRPIERLDNARDTAAMLQLNNFVAQGGSQPANFIPPLDGETFVEERTDTFDIVEEFNPLPGLEDDEEDDSDDECGEWVTLVEEEPDKIDIMVSASNERHVQRAKEFNWTRLLDQLHPVHMCQKLLTKNWTRVNWNETFNTRCNCPAGVKTSSMIDLVDLHAQDHIRLRFCGCTPDAIRLLRCGNLAGSPVVPQTAFSLPLLIFHNSLLHAKKRQHARDMRRPFTAAVDMYRQLERISESVVFSGLGLQPQQILANLTCPACFGPQPLNTSAYPETTCNRLCVCLDANFQQHHHIKASRNHKQLRTPRIFLAQEQVDQTTEMIQKKKWKMILQRRLIDAPSHIKQPTIKGMRRPEKAPSVYYRTNSSGGDSLRYWMLTQQIHKFEESTSRGPSTHQIWDFAPYNIQLGATALSRLPIGWLITTNKGLCSYLEWPKLLKGVFNWHWAAQCAFQADHTDVKEVRMRKMVAIYEQENVIDLMWIFRATESEVRDLINVIEAESEALKEDIANLSGEDMPAGGELFVQAVHLRAERQPVLDTKTGLRLGTNLKEKIFKAQNDRKPAVMKMITEYNMQYSEYKLKYPNQLGSDVGENDLLSYKRLSTMSLDDAFWNDRLFYHSDAPWAINANIRQGITCILVLSQMQEEFELIAQELVWAMSWAIGYHDQLTRSPAYLRELTSHHLGSPLHCVSSMKRGDDEVPRDHFDEIDLFNVSRRDKANHCQPQANPDFLATWRDVPKNLPPDKYSISGDQANNNDDNWEEEILAAVVEDGEDADVVASDVEDEGHD